MPKSNTPEDRDTSSVDLVKRRIRAREFEEVVPWAELFDLEEA